MKKIFISIILLVLMIMPSTVNAKVKIADTEYETFDEAVAQVKEGETITLLDDVDVSDSNKYGIYFNWLFPDNSTLDLNGHTIFTGVKGQAPNSVWLGNNITIKNGTFETKVGADYSLFLGDEIETSGIVLENITTTTGINIFNTLNVTLRNVKATGTERYYAVWLDEHATATIESGEFSSKGLATVGITTAEDGFVSELTLKGGIFKGEKGKFSLSEYGDAIYVPPIIKGGTYDFDVTEFVAEGYECKEKNNAFVVGLKEYDRDITVDENTTDIQIKVDSNEVNKILIDAINNDIALTLLRTKGNVKLTHDKTPENNGWTEWLFNSDIKVYADFTTAFTIETSQIDTKILEDGTVSISYDEDDIKLSLVDITDYKVSTNKSIFGSSYKPDQVAAFEQIARNSVIEKVNTETNLLQASKNLEAYFTTLATNLDVKIVVNIR